MIKSIISCCPNKNISHTDTICLLCTSTLNTFMYTFYGREKNTWLYGAERSW